MDVLFLGGTGVISAACVARAVETGKDVTVVTRGRSARAPHPGVRAVEADLRVPGALAEAIDGRAFDAVVDVTGFTPEHVAAATSAIAGRCGQYLFLSSSTVYSRPPRTLPVAEDARLGAPDWEYARQKIACEELLGELAADGLPVTIVRPSHTYDETRPVTLGGWTDVARMRAGQPVFLHGDPSTLWTITHAADFAVALDALLGDAWAIGETFNVMGEEVLTWTEIVRTLARAAGVEEPVVVPVPDEVIAARDPWFGERVLGDRGCSMTFDTSRLRAIAPGFRAEIPFERGARELIAYFDALPPGEQRDPAMDARIDAVLAP